MRRMGDWFGYAASVRYCARALLACAVVGVCVAGCSLMPQDSGDLELDEVQRALLPMASVALDTGQLETAKRLYQRLLDVDPNSYPARMGLGNVAFKDRSLADAARWYLAALANASTFSERHEALLWHGRAALGNGQTGAARNSFQQLVDERENASSIHGAWAFNGIGMTLLLDGDILGAIDAMEQAVQLDSDEKMFASNLDRTLNILAELNTQGDAGTATPLVPTPSEVVPEPSASRASSESDASPPAVADAVEPALPDAATPEHSAPPAAEPVVPAAETASERVLGEAPARYEMPRVEDAESDESTEESNPQDFSADQAIEPVSPIVPVEEPAEPQPDSDRIELEPIPAEQDEQQEYPLEDFPVAAVEQPPALQIEAGYVLSSDDGPLVQMGAFAARSSAEALAKRIGEATSETIQVVESGEFYRVVIGPMASEAALDTLVENLDVHGYGVARRPVPSDSVDEDSVDEGFGDEDSGDENDAPPVQPLTGFILVEDDQRFLQLGAFEVRDRADRLAVKLADATGQAVTVAESWRNGVAVYRVRIGPVASEEELADIVAILTSVGYEID